MAISPGKRLGRYEIRSQIGAGGMGEVYLAEDSALRRKVALKLLPADLAKDRGRLGRFEQEALTASALNHPNILTVFEVGEADSVRFIATEYVDGETLRQRMKRSRLNVREALDVAIQGASALAAAHKAGVVHRDIKPENLMIRHDDGIVKVLDFGLAKPAEKPLAQPSAEDLEAATRAMVNTGPGVVMGTASYMSPEQARGLAVDERTDIWSLGVVLYEMVAGRVPFEGQTPSDAISMILHKEPPALTRLSDEATERLDEIVTKTLAKNRDERYQVAKDLLIDLRRLKQHLDFESEVERTFAPDLRKSAETQPVSNLSGQLAAPSAAISGAQSTPVSAPAPTQASSAEYIVSEIKRHKRGFGLAAAGVLALAIVAVASYSWISSRRAHALTDKDTILLADFVNTTGDPVFDGTLKQALAVQLEQSPFLNIFGDDRVREALRFMGRSPDERLTRDMARELCQRQAIKALLAGAISGLGSHYVITLEAVNAQSGDTIAREQAEAENKEQVLKRLGEAATKLREKLGESLASIKKFDAPLEEATTSSLEALKAYSMGRELANKGKYHESIPFLKRAVELDPNFAKAYNSLAISYDDTRQREVAIENYQKAFDLRERASEHEKLKIVADYYGPATGEIEKSIEAYELLTRTYPRDPFAWNNLGLTYNSIGQFEKAAEAYRESIRLDQNEVQARSNLASTFILLNRLDEAKQVLEEALARKLEVTGMHSSLYQIAFVQGDAVAMKQQIDWIIGRPDEYEGQRWQAQVAAFSGQLRKEREFNQRAVELALQHEQKEVAAGFIANRAGIEAFFGHCDQVSSLVSKAFDISRSTLAVRFASAAFSFCGDSGHAQPLMDEQLKRFPNATLQNIVFVPLSRAEIALHNGNAAQAVELLESAHRFESVGGFAPQYVRGQAYLKLNKGAEAAAEFQKILDHRGGAVRSALYPLAYIGLARAAVLQGDTAKARKAYQDFFALWKDADQDLPILIEAKKEYEKLK